MSFYVKPPEGRLSLLQFHEFAVTRLRFLLALCKGQELNNQDVLDIYKDLTQNPEWVSNSLCLQEGSAQDRASHFILQLLCSDHYELQSSVLLAEAILFHCRLELYSTIERKRSLSELGRHVSYLKKSESACFRSIHDTVLDLNNQLVAKNLVGHCFSDKGRVCEDHYVTIHYLNVLPLVARRLVTLHQGLAQICCKDIPRLLRLVFEQIMSNSVDLLKSDETVIDDSRMFIIRSELISILKLNQPNFYKILGNGFITTLHIPAIHSIKQQAKPALLSKDVDNTSKFFSPCMKNLHQLLRHRHRLRHHARIQYSLFLKEIGMPLDEAFNFWKNEYSQTPCRSQSGCCDHHWSKDVKRYEYSLKHLYGLTGSRKNYSGQSCAVIQSSCSTSHEGGCPFAFHSEENLSELLQRHFLDDLTWNSILEQRRRQNYNSSCSLYLKHLKGVDDIEDFGKPAQFFYLAQQSCVPE